MSFHDSCNLNNTFIKGVKLSKSKLNAAKNDQRSLSSTILRFLGITGHHWKKDETYYNNMFLYCIRKKDELGQLHEDMIFSVESQREQTISKTYTFVKKTKKHISLNFHELKN